LADNERCHGELCHDQGLRHLVNCQGRNGVGYINGDRLDTVDLDCKEQVAIVQFGLLDTRIDAYRVKPSVRRIGRVDINVVGLVGIVLQNSGSRIAIALSELFYNNNGRTVGW
jgi:hypothetical protein